MDMNELVRTVRKKLFNKEDIGLRIPVLLGYMAGYFFDFYLTYSDLNFPSAKLGHRNSYPILNLILKLQIQDFYQKKVLKQL